MGPLIGINAAREGPFNYATGWASTHHVAGCLARSCARLNILTTWSRLC